MADIDLNKIAARYGKLKALANDPGATEAEAQRAAEAMQRLMNDNNLSIAEIEAAGGNAGEGSKRSKDNIGHRTVYKWQRELMSQIAELNHCHCEQRFDYSRRSTVFDGYLLIGREANVVSTRVMFQYLVEAIERVARDHVNNDPAQYFTKYAHSFKHGCSERIVERLQEKQEQMLAEQEAKARQERARQQHPAAAKSNLPAVILRDFVADEKDLNNDMRRGWEPGTTAKKREDDRIESERYEAEQADKLAVKIARLVADEPDINRELADFIARGWDRIKAEIYLGLREAPPEKEETEAQRRKRHQREENENRRWRDRQYREKSKLDSRGYQAGQDAGASISLDKQVNKTNQGKLS